MSNSIPDINARTPHDKERILEQTEKKIMRNERLWNTNRLYRLIVQTIVDAVLPNYYHDPQSVRRNNPVEYRASVASIKEEYSKFIKERWVPLINIQLSLGEDQARENGFDDETVIGDSNVNLCAMILGGKDTPSPWCAWCEQYDTMTSIYNDGIEGRFQDLRNIGGTYDRSEIPRSFVNLKNMMYYECVDCNKEIYSQPNRCLREECKCSDCD